MSQEIKIRKMKEPLPDRNSYPFSRLEVGEGFSTASESVRSAASHFGKRYNKRFVVSYNHKTKQFDVERKK